MRIVLYGLVILLASTGFSLLCWGICHNEKRPVPG